MTDLKPLLGALFPELVLPFTWFGWVDMDLMVSGAMLASLASACA